MLLAVDFDCGTFRLAPIDTEIYEDESFYVSYEHCSKPRKVKVMINGKVRSLSLHTLWGAPKNK